MQGLGLQLTQAPAVSKIGPEEPSLRSIQGLGLRPPVRLRLVRFHGSSGVSSSSKDSFPSSVILVFPASPY